MSNKAKIRDEAKKLNPIDDLMFRKIAEDKAFCEEILRVILSDPKLIVLSSTPQWTGANLQGRSVILDAICQLGDGRTINIEVQKANNDNQQKRIRYNGAILTTNIAEPGEAFENVPNVCVILISKFDIFHENLPIYHIDRVIRETGSIVENGFEEIYVNTKVKDGSEISELMEVFVEDAAYNNKFPITSKRKRIFKESEGGLDIMCELIEEIRTEGKLEGKLETLYSLVIDGIISLTEGAKRANMTESVFSANMNKFQS